jgi:hypothetical protein
MVNNDWRHLFIKKSDFSLTIDRIESINWSKSVKNTKISHKNILSLFVLLILCLLIPPTVFCQTEKLGIVKYTPPKNWSKTTKENIRQMGLVVVCRRVSET